MNWDQLIGGFLFLGIPFLFIVSAILHVNSPASIARDTLRAGAPNVDNR